MHSNYADLTLPIKANITNVDDILLLKCLHDKFQLKIIFNLA